MTTRYLRLPNCEHFLPVKASHLLGAKRRFRMGVAGWRFAHKTKDQGRTNVIAILEEWPMIFAAVVAVGAMIMIAVMLYSEWSAPY
jgi:hypothetical protein